MRQAGIYAITCTVTGEQYVGSSQNTHTRWNKHKRQLRRNEHENPHLQYAYNKYGVDAFIFDVLEVVTDIENLIPREQYYLDTLKPAYNIRVIADRNTGLQHTPDAIEKIRAAHTGRKFSEEHRRNLSIAKSNPSPEARARSSAVRKGKVNRALVEASAKANRGKKRPPEVVAKIVATRRLRHAQGLYAESTQMRQEHAKTLAEANRGTHRSQETRERMSDSAQRRSRDEQTGRFLKGEV